jgi:hypothetical protein
MLRLALLLSLSALPALAQDVPAAPAPVAVPGVPSVEDSPMQFAALLVQLGQQGRWGPLVALVVFALVFVLRKFVGKLPEGKVRDWLLSKWGGWALNLVTALSAGFAAVLMGGGALSVGVAVNIIGGALLASLGAAGIVELQKDAAAKGESAAAVIDTKTEAANLLEKGPPAP